jgi:thiamine kinase-like enzyme
MDYIHGETLLDELQNLTDNETFVIGLEIAQFLNELFLINYDYYDIGHYITTVPRFNKSWKEGHLQYITILKKIFLNWIYRKAGKSVSKTFDYIDSNIDSLEFQSGTKLLHNDLHTQNIIVNNGRLSGIIDWECS